MPQPPACPHIPTLPMRRRDRSIEDEAWICAFLRRAPVGAFACTNAGRPHLIPNLFAFDPERRTIVFHSARKGTTRSCVEAGSTAAFSVWEMGRLLPHAEVAHFSVEFASVVLHGNVEIVDGDEAFRDIDLFMSKYSPHLRPEDDYRPAQVADLGRTTWYRLKIEGWSGKRKQVEPDFPGAYTWEDVLDWTDLQRQDFAGAELGDA